MVRGHDGVKVRVMDEAGVRVDASVRGNIRGYGYVVTPLALLDTSQPASGWWVDRSKVWGKGLRLGLYKAKHGVTVRIVGTFSHPKPPWTQLCPHL